MGFGLLIFPLFFVICINLYHPGYVYVITVDTIGYI